MQEPRRANTPIGYGAGTASPPLHTRHGMPLSLPSLHIAETARPRKLGQTAGSTDATH